MKAIYKILDIPLIYNLSQFLLAPGWNWWIKRFLKKLFSDLNLTNKKGLDIGCGPKSLLWSIEQFPDGLDLNPQYIKNFNEFQEKGKGHVGSCTQVNFPDNSYDYVISIGLIHHLDDKTAKQALLEMQRVCKKDGHVIILDAVMPKTPFLIIPWIIRKLDRGEFVRSENKWKLLIDSEWNLQRKFYSLNLLEALIAIKRV